MKFRAALLPLIALLASPLGAVELRVTGPELARMIESTFAGTSIHLADDSTVRGRPASFIQLGPALRGQRMYFSMPAHDVGLGFGGKARFLVNDVNSDPNYLAATPAGRAKFGQTITVGATAGEFVMTVRFEDEGIEIRGVPGGRLASLRDSVVPDVQINSISLQIRLVPVTLPGGAGIAFRPAIVSFGGNIESEGLSTVSLFGRKVDLLDELTNYKAELKRTIEREVARTVDANLPVIAANLTTEIRRRGAALGVTVSSVRFEGTSLVISGGL